MGLAVVAFLRTVGIAVSGTADVARIVEPNTKVPAAETAGGNRLLLLTRVHFRSHRLVRGGARY